MSMTFLTPDQFLELAFAACSEAKEQGWKIQAGNFGSLQSKTCCPLTAVGLRLSEKAEVLFAEGDVVNLSVLDMTLQKAGMGDEESLLIWSGFDHAHGVVDDDDDVNNHWFQTGVKLAGLLREKGIKE